MAKYVCPCGYVYDPEVGDPDNGIAPGTAWEDLPEGLARMCSRRSKSSIIIRNATGNGGISVLVISQIFQCHFYMKVDACSRFDPAVGKTFVQIRRAWLQAERVIARGVAVPLQEAG